MKFLSSKSFGYGINFRGTKYSTMFAGNESAAFTLLITTIELSPPSWTGSVLIELHEDGVANRGNTTVQLRLVPMATFNESGVILHDVLTLTIIDTDSK